MKTHPTANPKKSSLLLKVLNRLIPYNYHIAKTYFQHKKEIEFQLKTKEPILIYQMGKVGSKSIEHSLALLKLSNPIFHAHFLSENRLKQLETDRKRYFRGQKYHVLKRTWHHQWLRKTIASPLPKGQKWKIITLVRDPIARNISTFFENTEFIDIGKQDEFKAHSDYYEFDLDLSLHDVQPLIDIFFKKLVHKRPLVYFDDEFKNLFGIDVFSSPFPQKKGYTIYNEKNVDILLIRLENLNQCASHAMYEFLKIQNFVLQDANVGSNKVYAPIYKKVKENLPISNEYIEEMYNSRFSQHFYNEDEIQEFKKKWRNTG